MTDSNIGEAVIDESNDDERDSEMVIESGGCLGTPSVPVLIPAREALV